ncbi:MAG: hypothetical protein MH252_08480 [Thermosynechococcaceae cyanobacterium MS004]|nr:hypothetical protein [Thermosynechococcaceae cyanobacterium MS004]
MLGDEVGVFFDLGEFAQTASVGGRSFLVIFAESFDPTYMRDMFDYMQERVGATAQARNIQAIAKTSDCDNLTGATLAIGGKSYLVQQVYPIEDGQLSTIVLNEGYG